MLSIGLSQSRDMGRKFDMFIQVDSVWFFLFFFKLIFFILFFNIGLVKN